MGKELAAGFDIAGVFSEAAINSVFQLAYHAGLLPVHATTEFEHPTGTHTLELHYLTPTLQFAVLDDVPNLIKLRFPFLAQVPSMNAQGAGAISVFVTASKLQALDDDNAEFNFVVLDFATIPIDQYQFETEQLPQLPNAFAHTFDVLDPAIVVDTAAPLATSVLAAGITNIPITPKVPSAFGFFTFRTYVDEGFVLPPQGTPYVLPRVLGAFVNVENDPRDPPASPPLELVQHIVPHPHQASYLWAEADPLKIALPEPLITDTLDAALIERGLSPLPAELEISGETRTVNELHISLGDDHLLVTGDVDDVEFTLKFKLVIEDDGLQAIVIYKDFDLPWYLDLVEVLLPAIGSAIIQAIELSIAKGLDSLGSEAGGLLGGLNVFSNELPGVTLAQLRIHNNGDVDVSPAGLILNGQVETLLTGLGVEPPFYVYGHLTSHEFHRMGQGCPFLAKLKPVNTIIFLSPATALSMGYNGCRFCYIDYDAATAARILLRFRDLDAATHQAVRHVSIACELLQPITSGDLEVRPIFDLPRTYTGQLKDDGIVYFSDFGLPDFLPGQWQLTVSEGSWTTTNQVFVTESGKQNNQNTHLAFTVGVQGCGQAIGVTPEFPKA